MKRKTTITIILIGIIIIASVSSIFFYNKEHKVMETRKEVKELLQEKVSISDLKQKLEDAGIQIEAETENKESKAIGASKGVTYMISGKVIQVYEFDLDNTEELSASNLKLAREEGKVVMPSMDNLEINVKYNKGLILINYQEHPEKEKILEVFESL